MKKLSIILFVCLCCNAVFAQTRLERAHAALDTLNYEAALGHVDVVLNSEPKNVEALVLKTIILASTEMYGDAIEYATKAIECAPKKGELSKDKIYAVRAGIFKYELEEYGKAIADFSSAIKLNKKSSDYYTERAHCYALVKENAKAEKDYLKSIELSPYKAEYMDNYARFLMSQNDTTQALELVNKAIKYEPNYINAYYTRSRIYSTCGRYTASIDDMFFIIDNVGFSEFSDRELFWYYFYNESDYVMQILSQKIAENPDDVTYRSFRIDLYEHKEEYRKAIADLDYIENFYGIGECTAYFYKQRGYCYSNIYEYNNALKDYSKSLELEPDGFVYLMRANTFADNGYYEEAIADYETVMSQYKSPDLLSFAYSVRASIAEEQDEYNDAITYYTLQIEEDASDYAYLRRGAMYKLLGNIVMAEKDFDYVLSLDSVWLDTKLLAFAYTENKVEVDNLVNSEEGQELDNYNIACAYSMLGDVDNALKYLEKSLQNGYKAFHHIDVDTDLDSIRNNENFKKMIDKYRKKHISNKISSFFN